MIYTAEWAFFFEPFTGSRAIRDALLTLPGTKEEGHHAKQADVQFEGTTYCVFRNPFDCMVTRYCKTTTQGRPLADWLEMYWDHQRTDPILGVCPHPTHAMRWPAGDEIQRRFGVSVPFNAQYATPGKRAFETYYTHQLVRRLSRRGGWPEQIKRWRWECEARVAA
jgi:hypothetical protein